MRTRSFWLAISMFTVLFVIALLATTFTRLWLAGRQRAHVIAHRGEVPAAFRDRIALEAHQRAADYTVARVGLARADLIASAALLLAFTLGGGLQWLHDQASGLFTAGLFRDLLFVGLVGAVSTLVELPFQWYRCFVVEQKFGFNTMTPALFLADQAKQWLISLFIGLPVLWVALWMMNGLGSVWWLFVWAFWLFFSLAMMVIYPTLIAPLFNTFEPLPEGEMKRRIEALLARCGFRSSGLFVMDGSRRSAHGNAYFTGFGKAKRIVFFDTLLAKLGTNEIEAVLAHELGHFTCRHVWKRVGWLAGGSFVFFAALGWLIDKEVFYASLGLQAQGNAVALVLFALVLPVFTFPLAPLMSMMSRTQEYEADAYAARQTDARWLVSALVKLYRDNAATLTPDPLYSNFHDSHPPAALRVARLQPV